MAFLPVASIKPELQWGTNVPKLELGNEGVIYLFGSGQAGLGKGWGLKGQDQLPAGSPAPRRFRRLHKADWVTPKSRAAMVWLPSARATASSTR